MRKNLGTSTFFSESLEGASPQGKTRRAKNTFMARRRVRRGRKQIAFKDLAQSTTTTIHHRFLHLFGGRCSGRSPLQPPKQVVRTLGTGSGTARNSWQLQLRQAPFEVEGLGHRPESGLEFRTVSLNDGAAAIAAGIVHAAFAAAAWNYEGLEVFRCSGVVMIR